MKTNKILLSQVQNDLSADAWSVVVQSYQPLIRNWVERFANAKNDVDDITQEVFFALIGDLPNFEHNGRIGAFRNWLRTITVNRIRQFLNQKRRNPSTGTDAIDEALHQLMAPQSELSTQYAREHDKYVVENILDRVAAQIDPTTMLVFRRFFFDGEDSKSIAEQLNISVSQVYKYKFRVLKKLKEEAQVH